MQVYLKSHHRKEMKWYLDSGYSRHMTGNRSWFRNLRPQDGRVVKFADSIKLKIAGIGNIGKKNCDLITDIMLVKGLTHNLLSISQFCDQGYRVVFEPSRYIIKDSALNKIILTAKRHDNCNILKFLSC